MISDTRRRVSKHSKQYSCYLYKTKIKLSLKLKITTELKHMEIAHKIKGGWL